MVENLTASLVSLLYLTFFSAPAKYLVSGDSTVVQSRQPLN